MRTAYDEAAGDSEAIATAINNANVANVSATVNSAKKIVISHAQGGEIKFVDTDGLLDNIGYKPFSSTDPVSTPNLAFVDGTTAATSPKQFQATNWRDRPCQIRT